MSNNFFVAPSLGEQLVLIQSTIPVPPDVRGELLMISEQDAKYFAAKVRWVNRSPVKIDCDGFFANPTCFLFSKYGVALPVDCSQLWIHSLEYNENIIVMDYPDACLVGLTLVEIKTGKGLVPYPKEKEEN